jgi:excisionase family DNA binding protein
MGRRERQQVAYAVVELKDAQDELRALAPNHEQAAQRELEAVSSALRLLEDAVARLDHPTAGSSGLPVAQAADYLGVSEPTVRAWLKRGVLHRVPHAKPVLIERSSLRSAHRAIAELRSAGQDRDWLRALVDLLHDRAEQQRPEVLRGIEEMKHGELEPA